MYNPHVLYFSAHQTSLPWVDKALETMAEASTPGTRFVDYGLVFLVNHLGHHHCPYHPQHRARHHHTEPKTNASKSGSPNVS